MACLFCFSDEPVEDKTGRYIRYTLPRDRTFQLSMCETVTKFQPYCCLTCLCSCCCAAKIRYEFLDREISNYRCCQGYYYNCCFWQGCCMEDTCPTCCLALESVICLGPSISATRMGVMDRYSLQADPFDYRIIRFNNCLQLFACVLDIASIFIGGLTEAADILNLFSDCVFFSTFACMASQTWNELNYQKITKPSLPDGEGIPIFQHSSPQDHPSSSTSNSYSSSSSTSSPSSLSQDQGPIIDATYDIRSGGKGKSDRRHGSGPQI